MKLRAKNARIIVFALCVIFLASLPCAGQTPDDQRSKGALNCRYWNNLPDDSLRTFFLSGFSEAYMFFVFPNKATAREFPFPNATIGEMDAAITKICARPENARIWIWHALQAFRQQLDGQSQAQVEKGLEAARRATIP